MSINRQSAWLRHLYTNRVNDIDNWQRWPHEILTRTSAIFRPYERIVEGLTKKVADMQWQTVKIGLPHCRNSQPDPDLGLLWYKIFCLFLDLDPNGSEYGSGCMLRKCVSHIWRFTIAVPHVVVSPHSHNRLKGLCHQIRIAWKWYYFKGLGMNMRHLIFKIFLSEPSIFIRPLKFLCLGSKRIQIFHCDLNLIWGCSKWVRICSICVLNVAGAALFRSWT